MRLVVVALQLDRPPSGYESRNNSMNSIILYIQFTMSRVSLTVKPCRQLENGHNNFTITTSRNNNNEYLMYIIIVIIIITQTEQ